MRKHRWLFPVTGAVLIFAGGFSLTSAWSPPSLVVRKGTGWRYEISRSNVEQGLRALARTARAEDAWLCLGDTCLDIGYGEKEKEVLVDTEMVRSIFRTVAVNAKRLSRLSRPEFYHIHLFGGDERTVDPPSTPDIRALALLKKRCRQMLGVELEGAIFDGRGEWIFDISRDLEQRIIDGEEMNQDEGGQTDYALSKGYIRGPHSAVLFYFNYPLIVWESMRDDSAATRNDRIGRFINSARDLGVLVRYIPLE